MTTRSAKIVAAGVLLVAISWPMTGFAVTLHVVTENPESVRTPGVWVKLYGPDGLLAVQTTDDEGVADFGELPPATYSLELFDRGNTLASGPFSPPQSVTTYVYRVAFEGDEPPTNESFSEAVLVGIAERLEDIGYGEEECTDLGCGCGLPGPGPCGCSPCSSPPPPPPPPPSPSSYSLSIDVAGTGLVASTDGAISCGLCGAACGGGACSASYAPGSVVTLQPGAPAGHQFAAWSGDPDCADGVVTMTSHRSCTAIFTPATIIVTGTVAVVGQGHVYGAGIDCTHLGGYCSVQLPLGTPNGITAYPDPGYVFASFSPECADGWFVFDTDKTCTVTFVPMPAPPPPPPPPVTCTTPDPFVSLGGGTCCGDGWYPPGMATPCG